MRVSGISGIIPKAITAPFRWWAKHPWIFFWGALILWFLAASQIETFQTRPSALVIAIVFMLLNIVLIVSFFRGLFVMWRRSKVKALLVAAVPAVLFWAAVVQYSIWERRAYGAEVKVNLKNAATAQKAYFEQNGTYTKSVADLRAYGYQKSSNVNISNIYRTERSFVITATLKKGCKADTGKWFLNSTDRAVVTLTPCSPSKWYIWWE